MRHLYLYSVAALFLATTASFTALAVNQPMTPKVRLDAQFHPKISFERTTPLTTAEAKQKFDEMRNKAVRRQTPAQYGFTHALTRIYQLETDSEFRYEYNDLGQVVTISHYQGSQLVQLSTRTYHDNGAIQTEINDDYMFGQLTSRSEFEFDTEERLIRSSNSNIYATGQFTQTSLTTIVYDDFGNLISEEQYEYADSGLYLSYKTEQQMDEEGYFMSNTSCGFNPDGSLYFGFNIKATYYANYLIESMTSYNYVDYTDSWELSSIENYFYDEQDRLHHTDIYQNNGMEVVLTSQTTFSYNNDGYIQIYNQLDDQGNWQPYSRFEHNELPDGYTETTFDAFNNEWYIARHYLNTTTENCDETYSLDWTSPTFFPTRLVQLFHNKYDEDGRPTFQHMYSSWDPSDILDQSFEFEYDTEGDLVKQFEDFLMEEDGYEGYHAEMAHSETLNEYNPDLDQNQVMGCDWAHPQTKSEFLRKSYEKATPDAEYTLAWEWPITEIYEYTELTTTGINTLATQSVTQSINIMGQPTTDNASGLIIRRNADGSVSKVYKR